MANYLIIGGSSGIGKALAERLVNTPEKREANAQRHPLKRIGAPEDMANAAAFLLGEEASFITGQILHVDGGISDLKV